MQAQVATALQIDVVGLVGIQRTACMGTLVNADLHVDVQGIAFRALHYSHLRSVAEVGETHQLVHLVVGREGRVEQDIIQVSGAQYVEAATHLQLFEVSVETGEEIDEHTPVGHRLFLLTGIDELEVTGCKAQVDGLFVAVAVKQIHIAADVEGCRFLCRVAAKKHTSKQRRGTKNRAAEL